MPCGSVALAGQGYCLQVEEICWVRVPHWACYGSGATGVLVSLVYMQKHSGVWESLHQDPWRDNSGAGRKDARGYGQESIKKPDSIGLSGEALHS